MDVFLFPLYASEFFGDALRHGIDSYTFGRQCDFLWEHSRNQIVIPVALAVLIVFFLSWLFFSKSAKTKRKWLNEHLFLLSLLVLIAGFILYLVGYTQNIEGETPLLIALSAIQTVGRAMVSAFGMFIPETDFIEVGHAYHHNVLYLAIYAMVHLMGILISVHVVVQLVGKKLISNIKLRWASITWWRKIDLFVFWGINEGSITMANSVLAKYIKDRKRERLKLVFVETPSENMQGHKEHSLSSLFMSSYHGDSNEDRIDDMGGIILYPKERLIEVDKDMSDASSGEAYFKELGIKHLSVLCRKSDTVKFFLFSDDQQKNIKDTLILRKLLGEHANSNSEKYHIYCRARANDTSQVLEEQNYHSGKNEIKVHIIDDSSLSVLSLKMNPDFHPVRYVSINERAQVTSEFNALILGFGQTGRDALRFLYEFGTFPSDNNDNEERSPLCITVVDKCMDKLKGTFLSKCPALRLKQNSGRIAFYNQDIHGETFWQETLLGDSGVRNAEGQPPLVRKLNYIVIAMGDDKTNFSMAFDIYRFIMRYKEDEDPNFTIFVRLYERDSLREAALLQEYTRCDNVNRIEFFGNPIELYTYDLIINDKVLKEAQVFAYIYNKGTKSLKNWDGDNEREAELEWKKTHNSVTLSNIMDLKRQAEQDMSNGWHIQTKLHLVRMAGIFDEVRDSWPSKRDKEIECRGYDESQKGRITAVKYNVPDNEQAVIDSVALCEHLRWNALSELQGYISFDSLSEGNHKYHLKKALSCLRPWGKYGDEEAGKITLWGDKTLRGTMKYDYNALDTSIFMNKMKI